jgi:uncharacterized protein YcgL (UPF0745 family)
MWQKYGTNPELDKLVDSDNIIDKINAVKQGYGLDILINDEDWKVRKAVANQGYGLDILINDEDADVRKAVASQGYRFDILINDEDADVRKACYKHDDWYEWVNDNIELLLDCKYEDVCNAFINNINNINNIKNTDWLDENFSYSDIRNLVNSKHKVVRKELAYLGYGLDTLVYDEDWEVREAVANQGYGLDILINDEDNDVRLACCESDDWNEFVEDNWETLVYHKDDYVRRCVAELGYGLDILVNDTDMWVREAVAKQGYGFDILINDDEYDIRTVCVDHKDFEDFCHNNWENLLNNKDARVLLSLIYLGYGLDTLVYHENPTVRASIAKSGECLEILIHDENLHVVSSVQKYLRNCGYDSIEEWKKRNPKLAKKGEWTICSNYIKQLIDNIENSSKLEIYSNINLDEFLNNTLNIIGYIIIRDVQNNIELIKFDKIYQNEQIKYKFIVDLDDDDIVIKSTFDSKENLKSLIINTINNLKESKQFYKYADELENCI